MIMFDAVVLKQCQHKVLEFVIVQSCLRRQLVGSCAVAVVQIWQRICINSTIEISTALSNSNGLKRMREHILCRVTPSNESYTQ
jgi:hypothetical protein